MLFRCGVLLIIVVILLLNTFKLALAADVTVSATVPPATVTFQGYAPGSSVITIRETGSVVGSGTTNPSGTFSISVISSPGTHDFTLKLTDTSGRSTPEIPVNSVVVTNHLDTPVTGIHMPPTLSVSPLSLTIGETIAIFGQGAPGSTVRIRLNGTETYSQAVSSGSDFHIETNSGYSIGTNSLSAYLSRSGLNNSSESHAVNFEVGNCRRSDLDCDGAVNLTDFSILLYYWGTSDANSDISDDGLVSLTDFSIMLFDWTE